MVLCCDGEPGAGGMHYEELENRQEETMQDTSLKVLQFATLCIVLGALTATAHAQSQGSWTSTAPIPLARNEVARAAVGGKVHVIGGNIQNVAGTYHDEYDPATDRWRRRAPLPNRLEHHRGASPHANN